MRNAANEGKQRNTGQTKQQQRQREEQRIEMTVFRDSGKPMETHLTERRKLNNMRNREKTEDNSSFSLKSIHHFRSDEKLRFFSPFLHNAEGENSLKSPCVYLLAKGTFHLKKETVIMYSPSSFFVWKFFMKFFSRILVTKEMLVPNVFYTTDNLILGK